MVHLRPGRRELVWMTNVFFKLSKAFRVVSVQVKELLVSPALCNGRAIIVKFLEYQLYYEQSPKNDLTSV